LVSGRQFLKTAITWGPFIATSGRTPARTPSTPEASEAARAESLALQACDDVDNLLGAARLVCLEKLIAPHHVDDTEEVYPPSALVRLINEELRRSIEAADITIQSLRVALSEGAVQ